MFAKYLALLGVAAIAYTFYSGNVPNIFDGTERDDGYTKAFHADSSTVIVLPSGHPAKSTEMAKNEPPAHILRDGEIELFLNNDDGSKSRVLASKEAVIAFLEETNEFLEQKKLNNRKYIKEDVKRALDDAFADREHTIKQYANWFYEWGRTWSFIIRAFQGAASKLVVFSFSEARPAAEAEIQDHLMTNYRDIVLKPDIRNIEVARRIERLVADLHLNYTRTVSELDFKLEQFIIKHGRYVEPISPDKIISLKLDWDSQSWKVPRYRASEGLEDGGRSILIAIGGFALAPAVEIIILESIALITGEVLASTELAIGGAILGSEVPIVGSAIGAAVGLGADYALNLMRDSFGREDFTREANAALDATIAEWSDKITPPVSELSDIWYDDLIKLLSTDSVTSKITD